MKRILALFLVTLLWGCPSDDSSGYTPSSLVGLYSLVEISVNGQPLSVNNCNDKQDYLELTETFFEYYRYTENCSVADMDLGSWELQGNKIVLQSADPALIDPVIFIISDYSGDKMTLSVTRNGVPHIIKLER